jgi:mannose/fructose/N-acetylgalactosamine-specific phosphotransferase system component IID
MKPITRTVGRLLLLQSSWTYERMQGVGVGYASLPLLDPLIGQPERHQAAVARACEYFNAHPYLAGIAVGAAARAELDGLPPAAIQRVKTALAGPLGSLGDQLFWIGVVPAIVGAMLAAVALGGGWPPVAAGVALYLLVRLAVTGWATRLGFQAGTAVAAELKRAGLAERVRRVGLLAGLVVGATLPLVAQWFAIPGASSLGLAGTAFGALLGVVAALVRFRVWTARRLTILTMAAITLWRWSGL